MIIEDGSGIANAVSYVDVSFADAYHEARGNAAWAALDDDAKTAALIRASDYIESAYAGRWQGTRAKPDLQAMSFPRSNVFIVDENRYFDSGSIPPAIKKATAELSLKASAGVELMADIDLAKRVVREKVDVIEVQYSDTADLVASRGGASMTKFNFVDAMLYPLTSAAHEEYLAGQGGNGVGNGNLRLVRV